MTIVGTNSAEILTGFNSRNDNILGYGGDDTLYGLSGNDVLTGGAGRDTLDGGADRDMADYNDSGVGVFVSLETGQGFNGTAAGDRLISIEGLMGSRHDDWFVGDNGINSLYGRDGNDALKGGGGDDFLYGGAGGDTLDGGEGSDTVNYYDSPVGVSISLIGDEAVGGYAEGDNLDNIENVYGSAHNDHLWGDDRPNGLQGTAGDDTLKGYGGDDVLVGGDHNDTLYGMNDVDTLYGQAGTDWLYGGEQGDTLYGQSHGDYLFGENGNDTLEGGAGGDSLTGGAGYDTFVYRALADSGHMGGAIDHISDFQDGSELFGDRINLSAIDAITGTAGDDPFRWIGNENNFVEEWGAGQLRYFGGYLEGDTDGDFNPDIRIQVTSAEIHEYGLVL